MKVLSLNTRLPQDLIIRVNVHCAQHGIKIPDVIA